MTLSLEDKCKTEVGNCCRRPACLGSGVGQGLNMIWLKFKVLGLG